MRVGIRFVRQAGGRRRGTLADQLVARLPRLPGDHRAAQHWAGGNTVDDDFATADEVLATLQLRWRAGKRGRAILLPEAFGAASDRNSLGNTGQVVMEGNPADGWTLVSFNGQAIPAGPGLLTEPVVDARNLATAPQIAGWNLFEDVGTGDTAAIAGSLESDMKSVGAVLVQCPEFTADDVTAAARSLGGDLAAGETFSDAFGPAILGSV